MYHTKFDKQCYFYIEGDTILQIVNEHFELDFHTIAQFREFTYNNSEEVIFDIYGVYIEAARRELEEFKSGKVEYLALGCLLEILAVEGAIYKGEIHVKAWF